MNVSWCDNCRGTIVGSDVKTCATCGSPTLPMMLVRDMLTTTAVKLDLQPGDVVVFESEKVCAHHVHATLAEQWNKLMPGTRAVLLDGGLKVSSIMRVVEAKCPHYWNDHSNSCVLPEGHIGNHKFKGGQES